MASFGFVFDTNCSGLGPQFGLSVFCAALDEAEEVVKGPKLQGGHMREFFDPTMMMTEIVQMLTAVHFTSVLVITVVKWPLLTCPCLLLTKSNFCLFKYYPIIIRICFLPILSYDYSYMFCFNTIL